MKFYKKVLSAFTLLECLVALLSVSMSVLVIQGMTQLINQELRLMRQSDEKNWQNFTNLLRRELEKTSFERISDNFLYVKTSTGILRFGLKSEGGDFRKTNENGQGYQPMIFGVSSVEISGDSKLVKIKLIFEKGGEKLFIYAF